VELYRIVLRYENHFLLNGCTFEYFGKITVQMSTIGGEVYGIMVQSYSSFGKQFSITDMNFHFSGVIDSQNGSVYGIMIPYSSFPQGSVGTMSGVTITTEGSLSS